ncbi:SDR family oxidoreductase [Pseudomonas sp. CDFA 602]|uniref:SDR family oxidoreductase n=1 Tax=Pseudomonas californiensis TaxID=2829823 RepID=UPI001E463A23|nr:SDR family oxidoreductase [Pseudomonas californiensis]MCD5997307.1 SDR family oxidoreductase [Pseudomonas californiensis]MCD6002908.1 SDR family oxidoreductase [Pseudomonas californiensis]
MSNVFVIGAAGKVGKRLVKILSGNGHKVIALHRKPEQAQALQACGADPVPGNLIEMDASGLAAAMKGSDVVVFTAGAGGAGIELTNAIDGEALKTSVAAAGLAGVRRFLLVSAFPEAARGTDTSAGFENYMRVKKDADVHLASSRLDWVILRPGTLLDSPGTGEVRAGLAIPYGNIARDDVAAFLSALVDRPDISRQIIELTEGDTPVEVAAGRFSAR